MTDHVQNVWVGAHGIVYRYPDHEMNPGDAGPFEVELCEECVLREAGYEVEAEYEVCPEWDNGWLFSAVYAEDDPDQEGEPLHGFSKAACDGCHTNLYGERYSHIATYVGEGRVYE